jgi:vacuolar-type H+-ATPase subunit E/Vma4
VALPDILERVRSDAEAEAARLIAEAKAYAAEVDAAAKAAAADASANTLERARVDAERDAATLLAGARLRARDSELAARRDLAEQVLGRAEAAVAALPDERYVALIAAAVAEASVGGETLAVGSADAARLRDALPEALAAAGVSVALAEQPADIERGVVLAGDRMRVEVSPAAMIAARREELLALADWALFDQGEE